MIWIISARKILSEELLTLNLTFLAYMMNSYIKSGEISLTYSDIFNAPYSGANDIS